MQNDTTAGTIDSLFQKNNNNINGNDSNVKIKLISSDSKVFIIILCLKFLD